MSVIQKIRKATAIALTNLYQLENVENFIQINTTKPEFEGDYTIVLFSLVKQLRKSPEVIGKELGDQLLSAEPQLFSSYNIIKGFLNISVSDQYLMEFLKSNFNNQSFGKSPETGTQILVEYSSPNTNKPLHLGHLRNNFLGWSVAEILSANGNKVAKTSIVNDRGVHICKSMLAWKKFSDGATPESTGIKGDHLVGDYYVMFEKELKAQTSVLLEKVISGDLSGFAEEESTKMRLLLEKKNDKSLSPEKKAEVNDAINELVRNNTPIMQEVREMLVNWENGDPQTLELWSKMNGWVYEGFDETYRKIGSDFDKVYYESNTYLLGKNYVEEGLSKGIFFRKPDGSVWIDLTGEGLDEKLVLRKDGTSVYITQDLGLAKLKYEDFRMQQSIYVIGDEQNYHMKVLKLICQKLGLPNADGIYHLSYGMVELPSGRMKSREGTVVDADDLVEEMTSIAEKHTAESGKVKDFVPEELAELYHTIGMGALKFYLLKVEPKKKMVFNPEESIDFHGFTGPFIQYTHARIKSILRKEEIQGTDYSQAGLEKLEKDLIITLEQYPQMVQQAAAELNPSVIANFIYHLSKLFNSFYAEHSISRAETAEKKELRLQLANMTAIVIKSGMGLLGIRVPERM